MWFVYIVRCVDDSLYTGIARNVASRVARHNAGQGAKYTRSRRPVRLVYLEEAADRAGALRREARIKRLSPRQKRQLVDSMGATACRGTSKVGTNSNT